MRNAGLERGFRYSFQVCEAKAWAKGKEDLFVDLVYLRFVVLRTFASTPLIFGEFLGGNVQRTLGEVILKAYVIAPLLTLWSRRKIIYVSTFLGIIRIPFVTFSMG